MFAECYSRLGYAVVECRYDDSQDCMLHDKIIQVLNNKAFQERLIRGTN